MSEKNRPYRVFGETPISIQIITPNKEGLSWDWVEGKSFDSKGEFYELCRCGQSKNKPFCDGTHEKVGFEGRETATRRPHARLVEKTDGPTLTLNDAEQLCAFARSVTLATESGASPKKATRLKLANWRYVKRIIALEVD